MTAEQIGVAFPSRARDRAALHEHFPMRQLPPLLPVKPGTVERRCAKCGIALAVGPRLAATGLRVVCPLCAVALGIAATSFWPGPR